MIKQSLKKTHPSLSTQILSHLRLHPSRNLLIPESPQSLLNLLDCATLSLLSQILPPAIAYVTSSSPDFMFYFSFAVNLRSCSDGHHSKIPTARSKISPWPHSHLRDRIDQQGITHSSYLSPSIYSSMDLSLFSSCTTTKALARPSSQHSLSHEAERSHLELGSRPSTAVNSGNLNFRVLFPSNRLFVWLLQRSLFLSFAPSPSCPSLLVPSLRKALLSPFLSFPYFALIPRNRPFLHHQHSGSLFHLGDMVDQQEQQEAQVSANNPLENVITNSE